jgi:lipoyl(octanoyl) transferase
MLDPSLTPPLPRSLTRTDARPVHWAVSQGLVDYPLAVAAMETRAAAIAAGEAEELVWLVEHPPIYTAGVSARDADLLQADRFPVHRTGRGGQFTYHGPGQRVAYLMLDLRARKRDVHALVSAMEDWIILSLDQFGIRGEIRPGRVGVWVERRQAGAPTREDKIAAIGVKIRKWVSFHGISLNVEPDLGHFAGIVPCGISDHGVTSLVDLGHPVTLDDVDEALRQSFRQVFGEVVEGAPPL